MDLAHLKAQLAELSGRVAGLMLTNPNTLGLFEDDIAEICDVVHDHGGLVYCDGANMNALVGRARPGDMGFDVMHFNLHKTFSSPHGGGGPGSGPVAVKRLLEPYLPVPMVSQDGGRVIGWTSTGRSRSARFTAGTARSCASCAPMSTSSTMGASGWRRSPRTPC